MKIAKQSKRIAMLSAAISAALAVQVWAAGDRPDGPPRRDDRAQRPDRPERPATQPTTDISGTLDGYNVGPRGTPESLMLKTASETVQVNFPPFLGDKIAAGTQVGESVQATVVKERGGEESDHPLYRLSKLVNAKSETVAEDDMVAPKDVHVDATIKRLNYGRRGEVNGVQLDSGEFVHVNPEDAASLKLKVGDKISVDGHSHAEPGGHAMIGATKINGTEVKPPMPPGRGPGGPGGLEGGPGGRGGSGGRGGPGGADERDGGPRGPWNDNRPDGPPPGQ